MLKPDSLLQKEVEENLRIEKAMKRVEEVYENESDVIQEKDFEDLYSKEQVDEDLEYVRREEEEFERINTPEQKKINKIATIFEAIVYDQGELNAWLGDDVTTIKSSRFDDIKNRVDLIIEFPEGGEISASHLALAVDVTFGDDLREKMEGIRREVKLGKLATIKYFKSDSLNFRGEKSGVPKVVVGADRKKIGDLMDSWLAKDNKSLGEHPIQFIILDEIKLQLEKYRDYARKFKRQEVVSNYDKIIEIIEDIDRRKQELREKTLAGDRSIIENDNVYRAINNYLERDLF